MKLANCMVALVSVTLALSGCSNESVVEYSPDGSRLAFVKGDNVLLRTGGRDKVVARHAGGALKWSRDGKSLAFSGQGGLEILSAASASVRRVAGLQSPFDWNSESLLAMYVQKPSNSPYLVKVDGRTGKSVERTFLPFPPEELYAWQRSPGALLRSSDDFWDFDGKKLTRLPQFSNQIFAGIDRAKDRAIFVGTAADDSNTLTARVATYERGQPDAPLKGLELPFDKPAELRVAVLDASADAGLRRVAIAVLCLRPSKKDAETLTDLMMTYGLFDTAVMNKPDAKDANTITAIAGRSPKWIVVYAGVVGGKLKEFYRTRARSLRDQVGDIDMRPDGRAVAIKIGDQLRVIPLK